MAAEPEDRGQHGIDHPEPIAIVGTACRFPGPATSISKFWHLLQAPEDVLREFPPDRLNIGKFASSYGDAKCPTRAYLLEDDPRHFDAAFFRISPKEAHSMDPQQRILLEIVYEALEAAGFPLDAVDGSSTGVYVGAMTSDYNDLTMRDPDALPQYATTGVARSLLANRISYFFNFKGPSLSIDTACSSSMVALHQAVQCLRNGDATQAIVAGVGLLLDPAMFIAESKLNLLSPDSRSRMFDSCANGYARGEGCAAIILKPLSAAIRDHDHVECLIRNTGVSSNGRTNGITMPSFTAQAELIRKTYVDAGLDVVENRCQYFECHGTGTPAGDPIEARAVYETFFPGETASETTDKLYCGSVKTIIGHLEGCAGLAGLLKAMLAIQSRQILPNMHFNHANPAIQPYTAHLIVPTACQPWPQTAGQPLRASVNSFGLGGTNSHVILEAYEPRRSSAAISKSLTPSSEALPFLFTFSAKTREALVRSLRGMTTYIQSNHVFDLDTLSWTLQTRRSAFPARTTIVASDRNELLAALSEQIEIATASPEDVGHEAHPLGCSDLLGIFTGQGAQWPAMGRELVRSCPIFAESLQRCQRSLASIPGAPSWLLVDELVADGLSSRTQQAEFSQPLCTAVQIALVDLLSAAGTHFDAVIGHSSGEIGAAYAAGLLDTRTAMGIAYYRGLVSRHARAKQGQKGGMIAVGISSQEAFELCNQPRFVERIWVAASNSPSAVTLAGDMDAIQEVKEHFDKQNTFARQLTVDVAYHSPHMTHCADIYAKHLERLPVVAKKPSRTCRWFSSVYRGREMACGRSSDLPGVQYWIDNLISPVMFAEALDTCWSNSGPFRLVLEVGPHPALRGPVTQVLRPKTRCPPPYIGCLKRQCHDLRIISCAVASLWQHSRDMTVDFCGWRAAFGLVDTPVPVQGLPQYPWDHGQTFWSESRRSHDYRLGRQPIQTLLGSLWEDCHDTMTWRNFFNAQDIPWIRGHCFQGQCLFPGAGYIAMAVQAALSIARDRVVKLVEIQDLEILKAMVVNDESSVRMETIFTIRVQPQRSHSSILEGDFMCHFSSDERNMDRGCGGRIAIHFDIPNVTALPPPHSSPVGLFPLGAKRFYNIMQQLGIKYDGIFHSIQNISRIHGFATASAMWSDGTLVDSTERHLAVLDTAFQTGFAAFASAADGANGSTYLPAGVRRILIDPTQEFQGAGDQICTFTSARLLRSANDVLDIDLDVCDRKNGVLGIQVNGLKLKAVAEPSATQDRKLFARTIWDFDVTYGLPSPVPTDVAQSELSYIDAVERSALFYLQRIVRMQGQFGRPDQMKDQHKALLERIPHILCSIQHGDHAILKKEWLSDSHEMIDDLAKAYPGSVDLALLKAVGDNLPAVIRGESEMLEHMLKHNLLGRLYREGRGFDICNQNVANALRAICLKYPNAKILEIGAGTGGTTESVLDAIGTAYGSYTYTDISAGFFDKAAEKFGDCAGQMFFKTFNVEELPSSQGFAEASYDVVIAANVLHATRSISTTLRNVRSLLRPGGFLVAIEVTGNMLRELGLMGGLEGWWLGREEGRLAGPAVSVTEWHRLLEATGFSGIEAVAYDMPDVTRHNCSVFYSHAVNELWETMRYPLMSPPPIPDSAFLILGGRTLPIARLASKAGRAIKRFGTTITMSTLHDLSRCELSSGIFVLCLLELEDPFFAEPVTSLRLTALQNMLSKAHGVLWLTRGGRGVTPFANMMIGVGRALAAELPHAQMQFLDLDSESSAVEIDTVISFFLRLVYTSSPTFAEQNILWRQEPEVRMKGGFPTIPRVIPDDDANNKLNARRRFVTKCADGSLPVEIVRRGSKFLLTEGEPLPLTHGTTKMRVGRSISLHGPLERPQFLCFGHLDPSDRPALALSLVDSSIFLAPQSSFLELDNDRSYTANDLAWLGANIVALVLLRNCVSTGTLIINEPPIIIADAIASAADRASRKVLFMSSKPPNDSLRWITTHPFARPDSIRRQLPIDTTSFVQMTGSTAANILACLPKTCAVQTINFEVFLDSRALLLASCNAVTSCERMVDIQILHANAVQGKSCDTQRMPFVVEWTKPPVDLITVVPIRTDNFFSPDKTYLLVGLTGELGQSLCRFMTRAGGRHFLLASRNPDTNTDWADDLKNEGAEIRMVALDVADSEMVRNIATLIRRTMPPIGGVANGALVLQDSSFMNTTAEAVEKQLLPKVKGTQLLHQEFSSVNLDFFIVFSSLGSIYGNAGQSIYHAANMFMTSLIEKRQMEGLAGSVLHVGMISDLGYVARNERSKPGLEARLRAQNYAPLSETDFHEMMLQAVLAGKPGSVNAEVIMGVEHFADLPDARTRPCWYGVPRMSHFVSLATAPPSNTSKLIAGNVQRLELEERFQNASNISEARSVLQDLLCQKIEGIMLQPAATVNLEASLFDLGIDSLVAIELRNWFLKTAGANVPLLTIMGRDSIASICSSIAQTMLDSKPKQDVVVTSYDDNVPHTGHMDQLADARLFPSPETHNSSMGGDDLSITEVTLVPDELGEQWKSTASESDNRSQTDDFLAAADLGLVESTSVSNDADNEYSRVERMSWAQAGLFFLSNLLSDPTSFNVTAHYEIHGPLDVELFRSALQRTISRHEAYRTCFFTDPNSLVLQQGVLRSARNSSYRFMHINDDSGAHTSHVFGNFSQRQWNLQNGDTFEAALISRTPNLHSLVIGCHHIVMDGMSWHVFLKDLDCEYRLQPVDPIQQTYADFAHHQNKALENGQHKSSLDYWMQKVDHEPTVLPLLPFARTKSRKQRDHYGNHIVQRQLNSELTRQIQKTSQACQATAMQFYLAIVQAFFANFTDGDKICIGVTDSGRQDRELFHTIGHFSNLLPMCFPLDITKTAQQTIQETSRIVLEGLEHAMVPIDKVVETLASTRASSHHPLFQVAFNYRIHNLVEKSLGNCTLKLAEYEDTKLPYDITFTITESSAGQTLLEVVTSDYLYSLSDSNMIADHYVDFVEAAVINPFATMQDLKFTKSLRVDQALAIGRGPRTTHQWPSTLTERMWQISSQTPDNIAMKDGAGSVTYKQVRDRVKDLASVLLAEGACTGSHVAVICEPSVDTYVAMLAIFSIGAAYVPLDLSLPATRHRTMLAVCNPNIVLFHSATATTFRDSIAGSNDFTSINISAMTSTVFESAEQNLPLDPLYSLILFTSGSTGKPKAIKLSQSGIMNYAVAKCAKLGVDRGLKVLQQSSTGFDMSIAQAFVALASSGTIIIAPSRSRGDPSAIAQLMLEESINFTLATPSEYNMLITYAIDHLRRCHAWKFACSGGEVVTDVLVSGLRSLELPDLMLTNCYGPTETSCAVSFHNILFNRTAAEEQHNGVLNSVGEVIPNVSLYIIDDSGQILPVGHSGELCIGGQGVAKGYVGEDTGLHESRFVPDRFATDVDLMNGWDTMYKTGDLACLRHDGSLVFLGRREGDSLVKLRGLRIDLDEIATMLLASEVISLAEAVVTVHNDVLVAYIVPSRDTQYSQELLEAACNNLPLPRYMKPSTVKTLDRLPLTVNGKADRRALAELPTHIGDTTSKLTQQQKPLTVPEGEIRLLWREVLGGGLEAAVNISKDSDFFQLGGSSLSLIRMQHAVNEQMGVLIPLQQLYRHSTLSAVAAIVSDERAGIASTNIDWDEETSITNTLSSLSQYNTESEIETIADRCSKRRVLLTGATSFLGSEILKSMIDDRFTERIHCIAVSTAAKAGLQTLSDKVRAYSGSLQNQTLGLSVRELDSLRKEVTQIIHAGAQGHCLNNYASLRRANLYSTQFLAKVALDCRVPLHYISSARVILQAGGFESAPVSMAAHCPPTDGSQGFTSTKWASERYLEQLSYATGLPVVIHRPCSVIGDQAPDDDAMNSIIRFSLLTRSVPSIPQVEGYFDFKDVAEVAKDIVSALDDTKDIISAPETTFKQSRVAFRHHSSGIRVPFVKLADRLQQLHGGQNFEVVAMEEWIRRAREAGIEDLIVSYLEANVAAEQKLMLPFLGKTASET